MTTQPNPSEIARETLKTLATRKLAPTPDNYARAYQEISGVTETASGAVSVLEHVASRMNLASPQKTAASLQIKQGIANHNWEQCQQALLNLLALEDEKKSRINTVSWSSVIREVLRQMEIPHKGISLTRKKESVETVLSRFTTEPLVMQEKLLNLVRSWGAATSESTVEQAQAVHASEAPATQAIPLKTSASYTPTHNPLLLQLRELLATSVENTLNFHPELAAEIQALASQVRASDSTQHFSDLASQLRKFWIKLELRGGDKIRIQEGLLRLLRLLVENVNELMDDDQWVNGQIMTLRELIDQPLDKKAIADAERSLRNAIIRQSTLKQSLKDAKSTLKSLMATFIDRLGSLTESTGEYHSKIENYSKKISSTDNITELGHILSDIMQDTRVVQASTLRAHEELVSARKQAEEAESRVRQLEKELEEISELVHEDQLTGALNRRGMEETLEREFGRASRESRPICVALLDIDNFKQLNDTLGHKGGDEALKHLSSVIRESLRPADSVARYGGEEFLIILPDTSLESGIEILERLQRELTKKFFLHNNERRLITFSAGVALRSEQENRDDLIARADNAMYQSKRAGKNRVMAAT